MTSQADDWWNNLSVVAKDRLQFVFGDIGEALKSDDCRHPSVKDAKRPAKKAMR